MEVYLSAFAGINGIEEIIKKCSFPESINGLCSFAESKKNCIFTKKVSNKFLLDSGAFTYIKCNCKSKSKKINWDEYVSKYIDFINKNNIQYFFELDIDNIVGYDKVKQIRSTIESETGKQCIPVWHNWRGYDEYVKMCEEYDYVAIGGIALNFENVHHTTRSEEQVSLLKKLVNVAHKNKCKVHGLGFTTMQYLLELHFDSIDSTSYLRASNYGALMYFDGATMKRIEKSHDMRGKNYSFEFTREQYVEFNFKEWNKFAHYAQSNL